MSPPETGGNSGKISPRRGGSIETKSDHSDRSNRSRKRKKVTNKRSDVEKLNVKLLETESPNRNEKQVIVDSVSTQEKNNEKVVKTQSYKIDKKKGKPNPTESSIDKEGAPLIKIQGDDKTSTK